LPKPKHSPLSAAFSLIEAAIVLAIAGLVLGGIWAASAALSEKQGTNKLIETYLVALKNAQKLIPATMVDDTNYIQITGDLAFAIFPKDAQGNAPDVVGGGWGYTAGLANNFGGSYSLSLTPRTDGAANYNAPDGALLITATNLPQGPCKLLVQRVSAMAASELLNIGNPYGINKTGVFPVPTNSPICGAAINHIYMMFKFTH